MMTGKKGTRTINSMAMGDILFMVWAFIAGLGLGTLFFGGLWFTVKKAITTKIPVLWFFGSLLVRLSITLIGFYYITGGNWRNLLICVAGFMVARTIVLRFTKSLDAKAIR